MRLNLDQQVVDLYRNSRAAYHRGDIASAHEFYRRIRAEHGAELFWAVELPEIWRCVHPLGSVMGRAAYADFFCFYQGCYVGSTMDDERPTFTGPCVMLPRSAVLGPVVVGKNVWITAGTTIQARPGERVEIPDNVTVWPSGYGYAVKSTERIVKERFFSQ